MNVNLLKNSFFIDDNLKEKLNRQVFCYLNQVKQFILKLNVPVNIYLAGSFSRQEPSIKLDSKIMKYTFESDYDFFIIVEKNEERKLLYNMDITKMLNMHFPGYHNSVSILLKSELLEVRSCLGKGLVMGLRNPILKMFDIKRSQVRSIELKTSDLLDVSINLIAVLDTQIDDRKNEIFKNSKNYHKAKFVCESCKVLTKKYYNKDVIADLNKINDVISSCDYFKFLKARELNTPIPNNFSFGKFYEGVLQKVYVNRNLSEIILNSINTDDFLTCCQFLFIELFLFQSTSNDEHEYWLKKIAMHLNINYHNTEDVLAIRIEYMKKLHQRNVGTRARSTPDLNINNLRDEESWKLNANSTGNE